MIRLRMVEVEAQNPVKPVDVGWYPMIHTIGWKTLTDNIPPNEIGKDDWNQGQERQKSPKRIKTN